MDKKTREELLHFINVRFGFIPYTEDELENISMEELKKMAYGDDSDIELY